ncbi:MAG: hypothetical protein ACI4NA_01855, partial [Succinivibrio sp.]
MDSYVFTSFVGKQIFGVINAIGSAISEGNKAFPVSRIVLYPTRPAQAKDAPQGKGAGARRSPGTKAEADRIVEFFKGRTDVPIEIRPFDPFDPEGGDFPEPSFEKILFYTEGGMNFCVTRYVCKLVTSGVPYAFVTTDGTRCCFTGMSGETKEAAWDQTVDISPELGVFEILSMSGVPYSVEGGGKLTQFAAWIAEAAGGAEKIFPKGAVSGIGIEGQTFDLVWNCGGNHLAFLKAPGACAKEGELSFENSKRLKRIRAIASWAAMKTPGKSIYDCQTYVLCERPSQKDTLDHESRGKATALKSFGCLIGTRFEPGNRASTEQSLMEDLTKIFNTRSKITGLDNKNYRNPIRISDHTLVVVLGTDSSATTAAIAGHFLHQKDLEKLLLICTPELKSKASRFVDYLRTIGGRYGEPSLSFVDIKGRTLLDRVRLPADPKGIEFNTTPGTKDQNAFLTAIAARAGAGIWTINGPRFTREFPFGTGEVFTSESFNPLDVLRARGMIGSLDHDRRHNQKFEEALENVMHRLKDDGLLDSGRFNDEPCPAGAAFLQALEDEGFKVIMEEQQNSGSSCFVSNQAIGYGRRSLGDLFEDFVRIAFKKTGRSADALSNVKIKRLNPDGSPVCNQKGQTHEMEIDCLAFVGSCIVAASCKAFPTQTASKASSKINEAVQECFAFAASIGRFCL